MPSLATYCPSCGRALEPAFGTTCPQCSGVRLLRISTSVRVSVALLAVFTAPLVEEVVYRGILYSALARARGRSLSIVVVALLFAAAHFHQYRESLAVIAAILSLSLVLTLL